jgi:hypothetical protein
MDRYVIQQREHQSKRMKVQGGVKSAPLATSAFGKADMITTSSDVRFWG